MSDAAIRNEAFASKLALTYAEFFDGVSPLRQRVSIRVNGDALELKNVETHAEHRWPLSTIRTLSDQASTEAMTFAPDDVNPARLIVREVGAMRAILNTDAPLRPLTGRRGGFVRLGVMATLAAACFGGLLFGLIPWFAETAAARIPQEAEVLLGQQQYGLTYGRQRQCSSPDGDAALRTMAARLTENADLHVPLTLRVVDLPHVNATALPGGQVTIWSGLLTAAERPEEVAAVLAHEIGHVAHRDPTRAQIRVMGSYGMIGLLFADTFGTATAAMVGQALDASYTRSAEADADAYSHQLLIEAGVSPDALGSLFARMEQQYGPSPDGLASLLSTHPAHADRIAASRDAAARADIGAGTPILSDVEWAALRGICTAAPAADGEGKG
ncbi:M48 family metalloprotease [Rhodobacterales bacterium HKCCE3408]|nr:M48 family metalloprotease [Rhodobacterales bacterium HKCCE3408]